jgi:hypothetical protein
MTVVRRRSALSWALLTTLLVLLATAAGALRPTAAGAVAPTTTTAQSASASAGAPGVALTASVAATGATVTGGGVFFTVKGPGDVTVGTPVGAQLVAGAASLTYPLPAGLPLGTYRIVAAYSGSAGFLASDNAAQIPAPELTIKWSTFTFAAHPATVNPGAAAVTLGANVFSQSVIVNGGTMTFTLQDAGGATVGAPVVAPVSSSFALVSYPLPGGAAPGSYRLVAAYSGSASFYASDNAAQSPAPYLTVFGYQTTTSVQSTSASLGAGSVTLTATVAATGATVTGGVVIFAVKDLGNVTVGTPVGVGVSNGVASASYPLPAGLPLGTYRIEAAYSGSANFHASSNAATLTIARAATTTSADGASASFGAGSVTLTAGVTSPGGFVNSGTMTFTVKDAGDATVGAPVIAGVSGQGASASYPLPAGLPPGTYRIEAAYSGSGNFLPSDGVAQLTIVRAATTTTADGASASFGASSATLTAGVASAGGAVTGGTLTFTVYGIDDAIVGAPAVVGVSNGIASAIYGLPGGLPLGAYRIEAAYLGSADFFGSDGAAQLTIVRAATTTTADGASASFGASSVTLTAGVASAGGTVDGGGVTFTVKDAAGAPVGPPVGAGVSDGVASASYPLPAGLPLGTYRIVAAYSGSFDVLPSDNAAQSPAPLLTITPPAITTSVAPSLTSPTYGQAVTFTATVSGATGGSVTFSEGLTTLADSVALDAGGRASFTTSALGAGPHTISARYGGSASSAASSGTVEISVARAPLSVTAADASRPYGAANPAFTAGYAGFVNGEGPSALGGTLAFATSATATSPAGSYAITPSGLTSSNYAITFADGLLTVTPAPLTLVVRFDDRAGQEQALHGEYPMGVIHWGHGRWFLAGPGQTLTTKHLTFKGDDGVKSASFTLLRPRRVVSLGAYNERSAAATLTLRCDGPAGLLEQQVVLAGRQAVTIETGWESRCGSVTLASSNGWGTHFDDLVLEALLPEPPPAFPTTTVVFDDLAGRDRVLNGLDPAGLVDFGQAQWWLSARAGAMPTKHLSMNGPAGVTTATFAFPTPRRLVSLEAYNAGAPTTVTLRCAGQPDVVTALDTGQLRVIRTDWGGACGAVTVVSGNGWDTDYDNLVIEALP